MPANMYEYLEQHLKSGNEGGNEGIVTCFFQFLNFSFSFLICKHGGCGLVVKVKRLAEIALSFLALDGTGARVGQH